MTDEKLDRLVLKDRLMRKIRYGGLSDTGRRMVDVRLLKDAYDQIDRDGAALDKARKALA